MAEWFPLSHHSSQHPKMYIKPEAAVTVFELLMMGCVSPETCWAIKKQWNNKFYYTVASCWFFLWVLYQDARIHEHQEFYNKHLKVILYSWQDLQELLFLVFSTLEVETTILSLKCQEPNTQWRSVTSQENGSHTDISLAVLLQPDSLTFVYPLLAVLLSTWQWWHATRQFSLSFWIAPHNQ